MSRQNILGVNIDSTQTTGVLREVADYIKRGKKFYIVTPNPEIILLAQKDLGLKKILNKANISLNDGYGSVWARDILSQPLPDGSMRHLRVFFQVLSSLVKLIFKKEDLQKDFKVIKGREMFLSLVNYANKKGWKIYLLGGVNGTAKTASENLGKNYKRVKIDCDDGPLLSEAGNPVNNEELAKEKSAVKAINKMKPDILFVGFGAPKQEKWLYRNFKDLEIGGAMVVGGTFDYVSGNRLMPPKWVGNLGLEWLWRLATGSQKIRRVLNAIIRFPAAVIMYKYRE